MCRWMDFNRRAFEFWTSVATAQVHAAMTIATRLAMLMNSSTPAARRRAEREAREMVVEKAEAITEGARRGMFAAFRLAATPRTHPAAIAGALIGVGRDTFEPARRKVRANARRLSRP